MRDLSVLIFEDDKTLSQAYKEKFTSLGWEVNIQDNAKNSIEAVDKHKPNVILLDLVMPGTSGFDALEKIKYHPTHKNIPVIVTTNLDNIEDHFKASELNAADYIVKSDTKLDDIIAKVKDLVS